MSDCLKFYKKPVVLAIGGAKGGVGKSIVSTNLATQFASLDLKVALLDLDLGAGNLHTMLSHVPAQAKKDPYALEKTSIENLYLLPANGFVPETANITEEKKLDIIHQVRKLDVDIVVIDLGAGSSIYTVDFFSMSDLKILVTSPEPTALMNNFEFIKNILYRALIRLYPNHSEIINLIDEFKYSKNMRLAQLIEKIEQIDEWQAEHLVQLANNLEIYMVFNQIKKIDEAKVALRLKDICQKHFNIYLKNPGFIFYSDEIKASIEKMLPISAINPASPPSKIFRRIAELLLATQVENENERDEETMISSALKNLTSDYKQNLSNQKKWAKLTH